MMPGLTRMSTVACAGCAIVCSLPATAAPGPVALAARINSAMTSLRSLSARLTYTQVVDGHTSSTLAHLWLRKPNEGRLVVGAPYNEVVASNGKQLTRFMTKTRQYSQVPSAPNGADIQVGTMFPVHMFFRPLTRIMTVAVHPVAVSSGTVGGTRTAVLIERGSRSTGSAVLHLEQRTYARSDGIVVRTQTVITEGHHRIMLTSTLTNIRLNRVSRADLQFKLPADAQSAAAASADPYDKSLVAIGTQAPLFNLPLPGGGTYSLKQALDGRKAVLVNFWFYS